MAGPKRTPKRSFTLRLPEDLLAEVEADAAARDVPVAIIVREILREFYKTRSASRPPTLRVAEDRGRYPTSSQEDSADRIADEVAEEVRQSGTSAAPEAD